MRRKLIVLILFILCGGLLLPLGLWALTSNKDITVDDNTGDSPQIIMLDQDEKTLTLQKLDTGEGNIINNEGVINIQPSTDTVHYLSLSTASNLTGIYWKGHYTNDPAIRINSSGELEYRDEDEATWTTLDSLAGGGSGSGDVTGPGSSSDTAIVRFDGTTGKILQDSGVVISDARELMGVAKIGFAYTSTSVALAQIYQPSDDYVLRTTANKLDRDVQNSYFKIVAGTENSQDASLELYGSTAAGNEARARIILPPVTSAKGFDIIQGGGSWPTLMSIASTGEAVFNNMTTGNIATFHNTVQNRTTNIDQWGNLNIDTAASLYATKIRILGGTSPDKYTIFQGGTQAGDVTYTLPVDDGGVGQVLRSDGSGVLSWIDNYNPGGTDVAVADGGTGTSNGSITGTGDLTFTTGAVDNKIYFATKGSTAFPGAHSAYVNEYGDFYTDSGAALYTNTIKSQASGNDLTIDTTGTGDLALQVTASGGVGIGTNTPGVKFDIVGGSGRVETGQNWLTNSDARYKTNITTLEGALPKILSLRGVRYDMKTEKNIIPGKGKQIGFIAQELEQQFPEFVVTDNKGYKAVAYDKLTAILVNAIKEQQAQIEDLKKQVAELSKK